MKPTDKITSLKQLEQLANTYFPCKVTVDPITLGFGEREDGKRFVKLIVGKKKNPSYNPEAKDGLAAQLSVPDIRIIAVSSGATAQSIINEYLLKIKKSLETKEPVIDEGIASIQKPAPKPMPDDNELAESLRTGKPVDESYLAENESWQDEVVWTGGQEAMVSGNDLIKADKAETSQAKDEILEAINILAENIKTLADDLVKLNKEVEKIKKKK